jgi:prepilin-type N-terminal cleavage/methylation domain-containing protein
MKTQNQKGFTLIELLVVITIIALLASLAMPVYSTVTEKGNITKGINNAKQIVLACKVYASDNDGGYPDTPKGASAASDANTAFREFFKAGMFTDERIFTCPASPSVAKADNNIGTAPDFAQALIAGENHWSMVGGLNDSAGGGNPLVFENATDQSANPQWDVTKVGKSAAGRVWSGPSIIVGFNDGSVSKKKVGTDGKLKPDTTGGMNVFEANASGSASGSSSSNMLQALPAS